MNRRETKNTSVPFRAERLYRRFFAYYERFLLHFLLSFAVVGTLFFCMLQFITMTENGAFLDTLEDGLYTGKKTAPRSLSCFLLESSVYCPIPGIMQNAFSDTVLSDTSKERDSMGKTDFSSDPGQSQDSSRPLSKDEKNSPELSKDDTENLHSADSDTSKGKDTVISSPIPWDKLYAVPEAPTERNARLIMPTDLSQYRLFDENNKGVLFSNQTDFSLSAEELLGREYPIPYKETSDESPLVLILHTHGTEAYAPDGATSVPDTYTARSTDIRENVVAVGDVLADTLRQSGISVLHCETMFDAESYPLSYQKAAAYIKETVEAYPSIKYVFDVHRDALESSSENGAILRPVTRLDSVVSAQVMCVVGTNEGGAYHPDWINNLTVAVRLQTRLNQTYERFARPVNVRSAGFNGQYAPGAMILEIGSSGNSLKEAKTAAAALGDVLASVILEP